MFNRWLEILDKKSILLIGSRRSGKTTLLKNKFPDYTYITLDDNDILDWVKKDPKGLLLSLGNKVIIDEIQRAPELTVTVKYFIDNKACTYLLTGSSTLGLLDASADSLAGRINILNLPPASWGENIGAPTHKIFEEELNYLEIKTAYRTLENALYYGGFPEVLNQDNTKDKIELLKNYKNTYFTRDLMQISNISNLKGLSSILANIARSTASNLEVSNFAKEAGLSFQTTKKYLNVLDQAQLVFSLYGYQYGPAKKYIKASKNYFIDNGIIKSLKVNLNDGQIIESFVISELEKRRRLGFIDADMLYYYKSTSGREIDLIIDYGELVYACEIKATSSPSRKDIKNLKDFASSLKKEVKLFLFYIGEEYKMFDNVKLLPIASIFRGI